MSNTENTSNQRADSSTRLMKITECKSMQQVQRNTKKIISTGKESLMQGLQNITLMIHTGQKRRHPVKRTMIPIQQKKSTSKSEDKKSKEYQTCTTRKSKKRLWKT